MGLETLVKVGQADDAIGDGHNDKKNCDDGEGGERLLYGLVVGKPKGLVNSHQLEDEVCEGTMIQNNDSNHATLNLSAGEICGGDKNANSDRDCGDCKSELDVFSTGDDDEELNDETQEEEEIEFEEGNVNLWQG